MLRNITTSKLLQKPNCLLLGSDSEAHCNLGMQHSLSKALHSCSAATVNNMKVTQESLSEVLGCCSALFTNLQRYLEQAAATRHQL